MRSAASNAKTPVPVTVADLEAMDRGALAALWSVLLGGPVPKSMSRSLQRRFLAHTLQARLQGDLTPALATRLDRLASGKHRKATPLLKPGARLLRAWNGTTHVVEATGEGFLWNGTRHASLSAIARAITGARWSGPRFFGLAATEAARDARGRAERAVAARAGCGQQRGEARP